MGLFYFPKTVDTVHPIRYHEHMLNKLKNVIYYLENEFSSERSFAMSFIVFTSITAILGAWLGLLIAGSVLVGCTAYNALTLALVLIDNLSPSLLIPLLTLVSASVAVGALAGYAKGCRTVPQTTKRLEL